MHCEELNEIGEHLLKEHNFKLNSMRTVFYGMCDECIKAQAQL
jgi:Fur family ferric uptake transcriptional regulator